MRLDHWLPACTEAPTTRLAGGSLSKHNGSPLVVMQCSRVTPVAAAATGVRSPAPSAAAGDQLTSKTFTL